MIIRPPLEIFLVVGVIYRVVEFFVYLWKPENDNMQSIVTISDDMWKVLYSSKREIGRERRNFNFSFIWFWLLRQNREN